MTARTMKPSLVDHAGIGVVPRLTERAQNLLVTASGIERPPKIVRLLGCPVIGMTEQRLGDPDMLGIMDRQLRRYHFAEQVRVYRFAQLAPGHGGDARAHLLGGQRQAAMTEPAYIARDWGSGGPASRGR